MKTAAEIKTQPDSSHILISGMLSFATVPGLREQGNQLQKNIARPVFDFTAVTRSDSAALALLTAWARYARSLGKTASFINLPTQLMDLACLSRLDKILSLHSKE